MNNFGNKDIWLNRIKTLYINKSSLKNNDMNEIKKAVEERLQHMSEHLYNEFYSQVFIYEVQSEDDKNITVSLVENINKNDMEDNMFIVNEYE